MHEIHKTLPHRLNSCLTRGQEKACCAVFNPGVSLHFSKFLSLDALSIQNFTYPLYFNSGSTYVLKAALLPTCWRGARGDAEQPPVHIHTITCPEASLSDLSTLCPGQRVAWLFPGTTGAHRTARTTTFLVSTTTVSYVCHSLAGCVGVSCPELTDRQQRCKPVTNVLNYECLTPRSQLVANNYLDWRLLSVVVFC